MSSDPGAYVEYDILIRPDGIAVRLATPEGAPVGAALGVANRFRASHVEPVRYPARWMFRLLRAVFGEDGRVAEWTRHWTCQWRVDLSPSGGPELGPFVSRPAAIAAELAWIAEHPEGLLQAAMQFRGIESSPRLPAS